MVQDTACENCPFKEKGFKECPNYIETLWQEEGNPQPRVVRDCAPRRTLLLQQEMFNRLFALQKQANQTEGEILRFKGIFSQLIKAIDHAKGPFLPPSKFTPRKDPQALPDIIPIPEDK